MPGLVESFAATIGWRICECNVIVEGTSDVELLWLAAALYYRKYNTAVLGDRISIVPAGKGDDGGVDGVNRRLNAMRQMADADRGPDGSLRHRFIGLYDNDHAGRLAVQNACKFDRRLRLYGDLFLLHPIMPLASGANHAVLRRRFETDNGPFKGLDWEVEDLLSERILSAFCQTESAAVLEIHERTGRKHREFTQPGKHHLREFVKRHAVLEDVIEIVKLIRALHDYFHLQVDYIVC
jgi:hypothetical protein